MTLRITGRKGLEGMHPSVRAQIERHLPAEEVAAAPAEADPLVVSSGPKKRRGRPEQHAGRAIVRWADQTPLAAVAPGYAAILAGLTSGELAALFAQLDKAGPPAGTPCVGHWLVHTPNGGWRGHGWDAAILQGQGLRAAWPDYSLDLPVGRYAGLRGELKAADAGAPGAEQLATLRRLELARFCCQVWFGHDEAIAGITAYLSGHR